MDHDAAHKLYHALPEVVADLLRLAVPDLVDDLDLSTLDRMSGESVDTRLLTRVSDDAGARSAHDWPPENRVAASIRLQRSRSAGELLGRLREEMARFPGEGNEALREGLHVWARALWSHLASGRAELPSFEALERGEEEKMTTLLEARAEEWKAEWLAEGIEKGIEQGRAEERARQGEQMATLLEARAEEWKAEWLAEGIEKGIEQGRAEERARQGEQMATLLEARAEEWKAEWLAEGIEKGIEQGIEKGIEQVRAEERSLLDRLAALKFGAQTAERLSDLLDRLTTPEELLEVGSWIIKCDTGAELLDRVRAHATRSGNGEC